MTFGITVKKPDTRVKEDSFEGKRPTFSAPKDDEIITPKSQDHHDPAPSLVKRAESEGKDKIAELLAKVQQAAKDQAKIIETAKKPKTTKKKTVSAEGETTTVEVVTGRAPVDPTHIISDAEFVKRTRAGDLFSIHDPEIKLLFWANGGEYHLVGGLSYAQAFENLRREKLNRIAFPTKSDGSEEKYRRVRPLPPGTRAYVSGMPDIAAKAQAEQEAKFRGENDNFFGFVKPSKR